MKKIVRNKQNILRLVAMLSVVFLNACDRETAVLSEPPSSINKLNVNQLVQETAAPTAAESVPPVHNFTDACVESYEEGVDYFPEKVTIDNASGLAITYHNNYKIIDVTNPWRGADVTFQYVLVQCGTPLPAGFDDALIIEVPVNKVVTMATTQLPHLDELDEIDSLVGLSSFRYASNTAVRQKIDAGELTEIGSGAEVNVEMALDIDPDLVMTFAYGAGDYDSHPVLLEAGIPTVLNSAYMEDSPLGRSEWLKFTAVFFNKEALAQELFAQQQERYKQLTELTNRVTERPTVFANAPSKDTWKVPGGNSYMAQFLADAGAAYLWADDESNGTIPLDLEIVLEEAATADYWVNPGGWQTLDDGLATDERMAQFAAFATGHVFNNNARLNENGGNEYWELGVAHPEIVLADLIKIFHPELLPEHELFFYQQLVKSPAP